MKKKGKRMLAMSLAVMMASSSCYAGGLTVHAEDVNALEMADAVQGVEKDKTVEGESAVEVDESSVSAESGQTAEQRGSTDSGTGNAVETESSDAEQEEKDQSELWDISLKSDDTIEIKKYKGSEAEVVIPDELKCNDCFYKVEKIGWAAFRDNVSLQKLTISENIKEIDSQAFSGCTNLTSVNFAGTSKLQTIGDTAFYGDTALKAITIPADVETIGMNAFRGCTGLENVDLTNAVKLTVINSSAFYDDTALKNITIPKNVESIESNAFAGCKNITEIHFAGDGKLKSIGNSAFSVTGVEKVVIPESVESIGTGAFFKLSGKLKVYGAPGTAAEQYCQVTSGADFYDASDIYLNEEANISVPAGSSSYQIKVEWPEIMEDVQWTSSNESVATVDGNGLVTKVKKGTVTITAVRGKNSRSVEITFSGSEQEEAEEEASWDISLKSDDTIQINKYKGTEAEVVIPDELKYNGRYYKVEKIGRAAFQDNQSIQKLFVSENIKEIDNQAFARCTNLTSVNFTGTSKLQTIGTSAFYGDAALKAISIPADVETIGMNAFRECTGLESVDLTNAVKLTVINSSAFYDDTALKNITIPKNIESIESNAFAGCKNITEIHFAGDGKLKSIGNSAFSKTSVEKVVIPKSVESIGTDAFFKLSGKLKVYGTAGSAAETYCDATGRNVEFRYAKGIYLEQPEEGLYFDIKSPGESLQLNVEWPKDAAKGEIHWSSSEPESIYVDQNGKVTAINYGTAEITAERNGYTDTVNIDVVQRDISEADVILEGEEYTYNGKAFTPDVTVIDGDRVLEENVDYTVTYADNVKVGTATVTVEGTGEYAGEVEKTFSIMPKVSYRTQVQTYGWEKNYTSNGGVSGTMGQGKRLETIQIKAEGADNLDIEYRTHVQSFGWQNWTSNGANSGTVGLGKRLEAIQIRLKGDDAERYDVYYRVHAQSYGWLNWAKNGEYSGTAGLGKRLEAIQIIVVKKGADAPGNAGGITSTNKLSYVHTTHSWDGGKVTKEPESYTKNGVKTYTCTECGETKTEQVLKSFPVDVSYRTQVQTYGWQKTVKNGQLAGTMGQGKRMETMTISVKDLAGTDSDLGIRYNAHVQSIGWQGDVNDPETWKKDGENAGTVGMGKRLEAIQIELSGDDAEKYDVYYRVHAQSYGWLNWAKNGEISGTAGYGKRLEGIQIIVVEKGAEINTSFGGIKSTNSKSYIVK